MSPLINSLRPVGNTILLQKQPLDCSHFSDQPVIFYQSGTASLAAALIAAKSLHSKDQDHPEVLLPAYACPDLISACLYAGVSPVIIDLEPNTCWMSLKQIEDSITDQTIAIIGVRFLGIAERMDALREICDRTGLVLIEDSAQGFPKTRSDLYWQGDLNILSFGRGKPVNMLGGGAVIVRKPELEHLLPIAPTAANKQNSTKYIVKIFSYNTLIKPFVYGMATKLPGLKIGETVYKPLQEITGISDAISSRIIANIKRYQTLPNIASDIHDRIKSLNNDKVLDLPELCQHDYQHPLLRFPLLITEVKQRDQLYHALRNYGASLMYQKPLYQIPNIPPAIHTRQKIEYAETFSQELLTIPTHTGVTRKILDSIFNIIHSTLC